MATHQIFFIDSRVTDYQTLVAALPSGAEWVLINAEENGVTQIQRYLVGKTGYDSLQIISHGSTGALYLGSTILSNNNINTYAADLASIGQSLTSTGDILLYGCNVAQGVDGQAFIDLLSQYTGADVAGSTDLTGKNGDWVLEKTVGAVEASAMNASYFSGTLLNPDLIITGTATQGQILTVSNIGLSDTVYQWQADAVDISGATSSTLTLAEAQVGQVITVTVATGPVTSAATTAVLNINDAPTGSATITGTATQGQLLTATNSIADIDGLGTISYQWRANNINITGAISSTLTLAEAQVDKVITVVASYTDGHGTVESVYSNPTNAVTNVNDAGALTITGIVKQNEILTAIVDDPDGSVPISYQWKAAGVNISGATTSTLTLAEAQVGQKITITVTYTDGYDASTATLTSAETGRVSNVNDSLSGTVTISGTPTQDQILTASNNIADADGLGTISYQWQAAGVNISGATTSTLTLTEAQVGHVITLVASYIDDHDTAETVTSIATSAVANLNDLPTGSVTITGLATQGQTLNASNSLIDVDSIATNISYQWTADGVAIDNASTLLLAETHVGKVIAVVASYTDGHGTAESVSSAATVAVSNINDAGTITISGTVALNQTLTAVVADLDGLGTISYQWKADGNFITGATNNTFTVTQAQVGKVITITAGYTDGHGTVESITSIANNNTPTGAVTISGTATQGQILTATNDIADADGLGAITYQWKAAGVNITGATTSTLTLAEAQVGKVITVAANYIDGQGRAESVTSTATAAAVNVNDLPTGAVTITGLATKGQTLTAFHTTLADADGLGTITYQWKAAGVNITGATTSSLTLAEAQVGKVITIVASYTDGHGATETATSIATSAVLNIPNNAPTGLVSIAGTVTQGQILTASNDIADVDGLGAISYQWKAGGVNISGATSSTLTLAEAQAGKVITVVATYTDGNGTVESVASSATNSVIGTNRAGTVIITGTVAQGEILTAEASDADGLGTISYQWKAGDININGATNSTYLLTKAEADKAITVTASYTDNQGTDEVATSSPTTTFKGIVTIQNGSFIGGAGDEMIMGSEAAGADNMIGGGGNDVYIVDNIRDKVTENAGADSGIDEVESSISYKLGKNIEKLILTGKFGLTGTGNDLVNTLTGNVGNNILDGGKKADIYIGGNGHDTYLLDDIYETVITEYLGEGNDTIKLKVNASGNYQMPDHIENLILTGSGLINVMGNDNNNTVTGNTKANELYGSAGDDKLAGGLGNDVLTGGDGLDRFIFDTAPSKNNVDTIIDFTTGDVIELNVRVFKQLLGETGTLSYYFENIVTHGKPSKPSSLILYDMTTGYLYYDADGSGKKNATVLIGILDDGAGYHPELTGADFRIV